MQHPRQSSTSCVHIVIAPKKDVSTRLANKPFISCSFGNSLKYFPLVVFGPTKCTITQSQGLKAFPLVVFVGPNTSGNMSVYCLHKHEIRTLFLINPHIQNRYLKRVSNSLIHLGHYVTFNIIMMTYDMNRNNFQCMHISV